MNRESFERYLDRSAVEGVPDASAFTSLVHAHPWFQTAHLMRCIAERVHAAPDFEQSLKRAAVYAFDREVLFNLVMRPALEHKVMAFDAAVTGDETVVDAPANNPSGAVVTEPYTQEESALEPPAAAHDEPASAAHEAAESHEEYSEEEQDVTLDHPPVRANDYDDLQREILLEAITSTIEQEVSPTPLLPESSAETPTAEPNQKQKPKPRLSAYSEWLLSQSTLGHAQAPPQSVEEETVSSATKQSTLIDRFIELDPKITPGKANLFSTENLAKMSVVEDEAFVTETMAMVYAKQGHVKKAVKAFKLLSLKYPEKSVYFANQIKKLKERPNQT